MIQLFNTLSGEKEPLPETPKLRLFVCGPTVYDYPHIGNARTFVTFDLFVRYLRSRRINVFYLQNITDVDDKIIERARAEKTTWKEVAQRFEAIYQSDMKALDVISVDRYARATDFIPEIIKQVKTLIAKKHAYLIEGDGWYFDLSTFPEYGKLARRTAMQAEDATSRIDASSKKRNKGDFALWKLAEEPKDEYEPSWPDAELGAGRPGWHIEDTAISEHFFGPQYDLHGGAIDLKFPHHEAEIAQQESASGLTPFVKLWMHSGFLTVNGEKMSKSLKNFIIIDDLLKKHSASVFRMIVVMNHYRSPLDYTEELAVIAHKNINTISIFIAKLKLMVSVGKNATSKNVAASELPEKLEEALSDDFNTPKAVAAIFDYIAAIQPSLWDISKEDATKEIDAVSDFFMNFGIGLMEPQIPEKATKLAEERELSRASKQFEQSDRLRKEVNALGYDIEDTPKGPFLWPTQKNHN